MIYFKAIIALMFISHTSSVYADGPGPIIYDAPIASPTTTTISAPIQQVAPTSHYGTGEYYANAPCPYNQTTLPAQVISRSERIKREAEGIAAQLASAKKRSEEISSDQAFAACQKAVGSIIRNVCGGGNTRLGEEHVDMFEDHMRGTLYLSFNKLNYSRAYEVVYEGVTASKMSRTIANEGWEVAPGDWDGSAGGDKAINVTPDTPIVSSSRGTCNGYALPDGMIDNKICYAAGNSPYMNNCRSCLRPSGAYPRGLYPTKYKEYYNIQQDVAALERAYKLALGKAACIETHVDNASASGPNANAYRSCILAADPMATAADYCLFCDEAGRTAQKQGFDLARWGPSILTGAAWIAGGLYANNQIKKTREGNWEAGYPSDDRQPAVMTNYVMNGFGQVVNTLQSAGAFGCSPSVGVNGQGVAVNASGGNGGLGSMLAGLFGGNANLQVGGANGYPGSYFDANGNIISGGVFNGNPNAGPWGAGNMNGNIAANQAAIAQARANLEALERQNQQRMAGLNALSGLQATLSSLEEQNARTNAQIAQVRAEASSIYAGLGMNNGSGYYNGVGNGGLTGLGNGSFRIGLDVSGWAGVGAGGNLGYSNPNGQYYSGPPGTQFPPYPVNYSGPNYSIPNGTGSNYNYGSGSTPSSGLAIPSMGL